MKIKGSEYVRLHKILTNVSNRDIWEYLKDGKPLDDIIKKVPDEFYDWVKKTKQNFERDFSNLKSEYELIFNSIMNSNEIFSRKDFALKAINNNFPSILFYMYDEKDYEELIWKILYPDFSKPFKKEHE
jgi:RNA ligase